MSNVWIGEFGWSRCFAPSDRYILIDIMADAAAADADIDITRFLDGGDEEDLFTAEDLREDQPADLDGEDDEDDEDDECNEDEGHGHDTHAPRRAKGKKKRRKRTVRR